MLRFGLFLLVALHFSAEAEATIDPDQTRTLAELIASHGFQLKTYPVTTADGYTLALHRVVPLNFNESTYNQNRKPVIVHHGLSSSSADFFTNSPFLTPEDGSSGCGDNFGFCLVLTGRYDIWLPNSRGNDYSAELDPLCDLLPNYWHFSWDQMATYDTPAVIKYVQNRTGYEKIGWVGHSQGTIIMFALLAMQPQYADIIQPFVAWAPPIYIGNMTSSLKDFTFLEEGLFLLGGKYILSTEIYEFLNEFECTVAQWLCASQMESTLGETDSLNETRLGVYNHFNPSGASSWTIVHFIQMIEDDDFYRFDYGSTAANMRAYGGLGKVPRLDLTKIPSSMTIALMYGNTDAFVPLDGVAQLKKDLQKAGVNLIDYNVPKTVWNHADYCWGEGAGALVHDKTIEILDEYMQ